MKKLIPTVALALMGAAAVTGSTYAWFSMNKSVEATGMKVKATTDGALVIGTSVAQINAISVNMNDTEAHVLSHSTHGDVTGVAEEDKTGLKTITDDVDVVDPKTGVVTDPTWREAINNATLNYYQDYIVYIASAGEAMDKTIVMSMTDAMKIEVEKNWAYNMSAGTQGMGDTLFGFTVDVYAGGLVNESTDPIPFEYLETYHLDNVAATLDLDVASIPTSFDASGNAQGLAFKFRVYLDGEYAKNSVTMQATSDGTAKAGKAYFNSNAGVYTQATVAVGESVSGLYEVGALGTASSTDKYVHTEKANTGDLDLGFYFEAADAE